MKSNQQNVDQTTKCSFENNNLYIDSNGFDVSLEVYRGEFSMETNEYFNQIAASCIIETDIDPSIMIAAIKDAIISEDSEFLSLVAFAAISHLDFLCSRD